MKWIVLLFFLAMNTAQATDVYKCVVGGHSVYQSTPCPGNTAVKQQDAEVSLHTDVLPGCYVGESPGFEDAFEITAGVGDEFNLEFTAGGHEQTMTMRTANAHDLQVVSAQFHLKLRTGVTVEWTPSFPHPKPIGLYKGTDANGKEIVFGYFAFGSGNAVQVPCVARTPDAESGGSQN